MKVRLLGPTEVEQSGQAIPLGGIRVRAVLAMLALDLNRMVPTDRLIDGLWDRTAPRDAVGTVQVYVSRLRRALSDGTGGGPTPVTSRRPGYALELDPGAVDLHRFRGLARQGSSAAEKSSTAASGFLRQALSLWRADPLAEFRGMPFADSARPRLHEEWLQVRLAVAENELALGRHVELVGELEQLVAEFPLHERLHELLIIAHYRSGRQAEALQAFQRARTVFTDELGIDPGPALRGLEAAVLTQDSSLDLESSAAIPTAPTRILPGWPGVWNVPPRNPHFTGRDAALQELHRQVHGAHGALVVHTLYGLGGAGKTQLAIEYAHRHAADYDLVWWIDADEPALIPETLTALAARCGLDSAGTASESVALVLTELTRRDRWLLVFDNADRPGDITAFLPAGTGHILVTSRFPGWGALGVRLEVDVLMRSETVAFLRARVPGVSPDIADQLGAELGDLPLAAAQAAAYVEQTGMSSQEYLERFRSRRAQLLARGQALGYQGRLDTTWTLALERLGAQNPAAIALLEYAAFLAPEPIPLALFTAHPEHLDDRLLVTVSGDPDGLQDAVGAIVGYSLARRLPGAFQLHRLVQTVIRHGLPGSTVDAIGIRVAALLAASVPQDPTDSGHWPDFGRMAPHLLAIGELADRQGSCRRALLATAGYIMVRGDTRAGRRLTGQLHERWRRVLGADHPDTLAAAAQLVTSLVWLAEHEQARELGEDTLRRSQEVLGPDHRVTLGVATNLTFALAWLGEPGPACALGQAALRRARQVLGERSAETLRLAANLCLAMVWNGEPEGARSLGLHSLALCRQVLGPNHPVTLLTGAHLALALAWLGDTDADRSIGEDTLRRSTLALGPDHPTTLASAAHLCFILDAKGEHERACALGEQALNRSTSALGPDHLITLAAGAVFAVSLTRSGALTEARSLGQAVLDRCRARLGDNHLITLLATAANATALAASGVADSGNALETLRRCTTTLGERHPVTTTLAAALGIGVAR